MGDKTQTQLTFGFDIGIASVGWCVLGENRIVDLGVRCFDAAETPDRGESLNKKRRDARLMRRRLRRRAWRLTKLARLLKREGIIATPVILKQEPSKGFKTPNLWQLRVKALDTRLDTEEWARVLYHLVKHRGFHWVSKAEERQAEGDKKEGGPIKQAIKDNRQRMAERDRRSAAELMLEDFPDAQRNKQGSYNHALPRTLLAEELALLFERQRDLGNPHADADLEAKVTELFWAQKPPLTGKAMLERIGRCTFERIGGPDGKGEYRAPKASYSAEQQVWLTRLNNLRINVDGITRKLNPEEHRVALPLPYEYDTDLTYKRLHDALVKAGLLPASFTFSGLRGGSKDDDPLKETLAKVPAWQELRKALKKAGLETEWKGMAGAAAGGDPTLLDAIAWVLTVYKTDEEAEAELHKLALPNPGQMIPALLDFPRSAFKAFHSLSIKALRKIVPQMAAGLRYDEACELAGYRHYQPNPEGARETYLPPFYEHARGEDGKLIFSERIEREITGGIPRNPVVLRALNQARKVCNALIREYGSPAAVHIELARDLSRPLEERRDIEKEQKTYQARNKDLRAQFSEIFLREPHGDEFEKFRLYREQQGKSVYPTMDERQGICAYSLAPIDLGRLLEPGYVEIDHALPYSRSYDDSKNNKVLCFTKENREKCNRTPYEYLDGASDSERWHHFVAYVEATYPGLKRTAKRSRLLRKNFGKDEAADFRARNLNDTRYICKFFKNYVERYLDLAPKVGAGGTAEEKKNERCVVLSGQLTAFLRARWGLAKVRDESDRHHAMDAAVVAACSHGMVQRLSNYSRRHELEDARSGYIDSVTGEIIDREALLRLEAHFPKPWRHFQEELLARLKIDDQTALCEMLTNLGTYPAEIVGTIRPLFVSRAPQRRNSGAAHKDTIYAQPERLKAQGGVTQKVALASLKLADLGEPGNAAETCKLIDWHRNEKLYSAIRARLEAHGGKSDKAFPPANPLRKPDRDGNPTGPIVRSVTMVIDKLSGIPVRGGIAKNDTMLRVDIFRHKTDGKFHLVPVYVHHAVAKVMPNRAIIAHKEEDQWAVIDDKFEFSFSLYPNDLTRVTLRGETHFGYYAGCDRNAGAINLWAHDRNQRVGKDGLIRGIGVKTAVAIEKFHVDVLGNIYPAPKEERHGLA